MKNESKLKELVEKCHNEGKLSDENYKAFKSYHDFTNYKLESAKFFWEKLMEIEKRGESGEVAKGAIDEGTRYWDCIDYMLMGAYDGLFREIKSILELDDISGNEKDFLDHVNKKLAKNDNYKEIHNRIQQEWKKWIKKFSKERAEFTHKKIKSRRIKWKRGEKIKFFDSEKELVEKLEEYYYSIAKLIEDVYGLLIKELGK